jgi:hypothetical protein
MSLNYSADIVFVEGHLGRHAAAYHEWVVNRLRAVTRGLHGEDHVKALRDELSQFVREFRERPESLKGNGLD